MNSLLFNVLTFKFDAILMKKQTKTKYLTEKIKSPFRKGQNHQHPLFEHDRNDRLKGVSLPI